MKKKLNSLSDLGALVYSTNPKTNLEDESSEISEISNREQEVKVWYEKKGRRGKQATIVRGFEGSEDALKNLAKELKTSLGTGGAAKDGEIIIQGNFQEKTYQILLKMGFKVKKAGG